MGMAKYWWNRQLLQILGPFQGHPLTDHLVNQVVQNENIVSRVHSTHLSTQHGLENHLPRISAEPDHRPGG